MLHKFVGPFVFIADPFPVLEFLVNVFESHFVQPKPEEKPVEMIVIWEIGPQGYPRGRCVPVQ